MFKRKKNKSKANNMTGDNTNVNGTNTNISVSTEYRKKMPKWREKLDMYDMILANLYAGKAIIEPEQKLTNQQIHIGFSNVSSEKQITKYYMINEFPDFLPDRIIYHLRDKCSSPGVKINFYTYVQPYRINWDSAEMRSKLNIWANYSKEQPSQASVFNYRNDINAVKAKERIIRSTLYLNEAEIEHKRSLVRCTFIIQVSANRDEDSIVGMAETIRRLNESCSGYGIRIKELRINMIDWLRAFNPFYLKADKEIERKITKKIMTDDNLANFNSYSQGRIGLKGIPLGIDILSNSAVLRQFKDDHDKAENWLVSAETGGGKSMWVKSLIPYFMALGYPISVMDYEGDEYTNLAYYLRSFNPKSVKVVSMGKSSSTYFDPCAIPKLTGDTETDASLKDSAINYILAIYRIIVKGTEEDFSPEERKIMMTAIQRMYDSVGVTEDKETWKRSKVLTLHDIYREVKEIVDTKEFVDEDTDNVKHKAAIAIMDASSIFFEEGEAYYYMFSNPMDADELFESKFTVFSFGMRGAGKTVNDPIILALKQLSVSYINIQVSNYCKYVLHTFNVKIFEEFQRWCEAHGTSDIISNTITGGRKRGDINFIITNDLASLLDDKNKLANNLRDNFQNFAIGKIKTSKTREKLCNTFSIPESLESLDRIALASMSSKSNSSGTQNVYQNAFCIILDDGTRTVVKSMLPDSIVKSTLFKTGVQIQ